MKAWTKVVIGLCAALAATLGMLAPPADAHDASDPHAHHHVQPGTVRSIVDYTVPPVSLLREDGKTVRMADELNDGRPVFLNFIYTTCTSVCPLTSQAFSELQTKLGAARNTVHLVSISIDPEQDRPARLREYAKQFGAGPAWQHYTGTVAASVAAQQAFGVYRGDKMSHAPVTLVRMTPTSRWVRIEGFATSDQLLSELRGVVAAR